MTAKAFKCARALSAFAKAPAYSKLRRAVALAIFAGLASTGAFAQAQHDGIPSTIKVIIPFAPGGSDVVARAVIKQLGQTLGTTVYAENRPGVGGMLGAELAAKGPKDGSVLLFHATSLVTGLAISKNPKFSLAKDFVPIGIVAESPMLVAVSATSAIKNPRDLITLAREKPGVVTYGSAGVGSIGHLGVALMADLANVKMQHIPYPGTTPAMVDVVAGRVDFALGSYSALAAQLSGGRAVAIGSTSDQVNSAFPNILPMARVVPGYNAKIWYGFFAPTGTPPALLARLNRALNDAAESGEVKALTKPDGGSPVKGSLDDLSRYVLKDYEIWKRLATDKNIVLD